MIRISPMINEMVPCDSASQSLQLSIQKLIVSSSVPVEFIIELLHDTKCIIENSVGGEYVLRVFSDLIRLFKSVKEKQLRKEWKLNLAQKRLEFYLSWSREYYELLQEELNAIDIEIGNIAKHICTCTKISRLFFSASMFSGLQSIVLSSDDKTEEPPKKCYIEEIS